METSLRSAPFAADFGPNPEEHSLPQLSTDPAPVPSSSPRDFSCLQGSLSEFFYPGDAWRELSRMQQSASASEAPHLDGHWDIGAGPDQFRSRPGHPAHQPAEHADTRRDSPARQTRLGGLLLSWHWSGNVSPCFVPSVLLPRLLSVRGQAMLGHCQSNIIDDHWPGSRPLAGKGRAGTFVV